MTDNNSRVYLVTGPKVSRMVRAASKAQAVRHVVADEYDARVATQDELIYFFGHGDNHEIEDAATKEDATTKEVYF